MASKIKSPKVDNKKDIKNSDTVASVNGIVAITMAAFKNMPSTQRGIVALAAFGAICLLVVGTALGVRNDVPGPIIVVIFLAAMGLLVVAMILLHKYDADLRAATQPPPISACRRIPIYPQSETVISRLQNALVAIQNQAFTYLAREISSVKSEAIRANIFLLAKIEGGPHKLIINRRLGINMNYPPEWNIQLAPGQGATGNAFQTGDSKLTRRLSVDEGEWDEVYEMTDQLKSIIHRDLKWIISLPLIPTYAFHPIGVLNIDGLIDIADDTILEGMAAEIRDNAVAVADYLNVQSSTCYDGNYTEKSHG